MTEEIEIAKWFEESVKSLKDKKHGKKVANWIITEIMGSSQYQLSGVNKLKIQPLQLADLVTNVEDGKISRPSGKEILNILLTEGGDIEEIIQNKGLEQVSDTGALEEVVKKVIVANPKPVADYKVGKKASLQFLIGMVMRETKGKADVKIVNQKLTELLG
ncbi:MAG: Aspartyl/glutamyl-tRNA(Asn/Gln) amidotransferase subunit B [candidate division CPR3 bacterium GW2011_GWE2_35_7]|nr:MAG: Aspartyl/glutamyl-tRNA(Asn/Gln) amidotransferase subunit B [candidate division CPR3 bacterium GW2011_GWE2_35_7]